MAIFKCKMCGGSLEINPESRIATCEYCGSEQTLPKMDSEKKENLYDRADHFRRNNDYDKAIGIYEQILIEDKTDAEAYWSLVLCDYGIEYVEDPKTHDRIPTINRTQYTSIYADANYKSALEYASIEQKDIYEKEAQTIDEIQKGILEISKKEKPYDVFICYKESDEAGNRTKDSVLANDLYHQLTQEGFKVFFSRITLEDKLGQEYEPYIFAALNSAKVMVVLGTKPEHFKAVWVKNEWSRYLSLIKKGENKILVPAYKDMDPYDLPEEFSHLQAQDMSKLGFMQDLIRGIKKIVGEAESVSEGSNKNNRFDNGSTVSISPLLKRTELFLEDKEWDRAIELCEKVLNNDPENAQAYVFYLMAEVRVSRKEELGNCMYLHESNKYYQKALRFASFELRKELEGYLESVNNKKEADRKNDIYDEAIELLEIGDADSVIEGVDNLKTIRGWKDADSLIKKYETKCDEYRKEREAHEKEKKHNEMLRTEYDNKYSDVLQSNLENEDEIKKLNEEVKSLKDSSTKKIFKFIIGWGAIQLLVGVVVLLLSEESEGNVIGIINFLMGIFILSIGLYLKMKSKETISKKEILIDEKKKKIKEVPSFKEFKNGKDFVE